MIQIDSIVLDEKTINAFYNFFVYNNRLAMSIKIDQEWIDPFDLAAHEGFHFFGQREWTSPKNSGGRGTTYPLDYRPRYYRKMTFKKLLSYFKEEKEDYLKEARFWFNRWKKTAPEEVQNYTDISEGTARYVDTMSVSLAKNGCQASNEVIKADILSKVEKEYSYAFNTSDPSLDGESYSLGGLASLILELSMDDPDWQKKAKQGVSPIEYLLKDYQPKISNDDIADKEDYRVSLKKVNEEMGKLIDDDISFMSDKDYVRIQIPFQYVQSNFSPKFFANIRDYPGLNLFPLALELQFLSEDKQEEILVGVDGVIMEYYSDNPCLSPMVLIHRDGMTDLGDGKYQIDSNNIKGLIQAEEQLNSEGYSYYCWSNRP